jgi:hypothetical protein
MGACFRASHNIVSESGLHCDQSLSSSERSYSHTTEKPSVTRSSGSTISKKRDSRVPCKSTVTASDPSSGNRLFWSMSSWDSHNASVNRVSLSKITSKLFIGSLHDAMCEEELRYNQITHIISVIGSKHLVQGIQHEQIPMNDGGNTNLKLVMKKLWPFIEDSQQQGKALFVHCMSGQNRSATLMLAILMQNNETKLSEAWKLLKNKRPVVQIHERYAKQLLLMEEEIFGTNSLPSNWMEIAYFNVKTGSISIIGDSVSTLTKMSVNSITVS